MDELKSSIYKIVADEFHVSVAEISDELGPGDFYHWDSLGQIQLILRLEKEFNIQLSLDDAMSINKIKDIVTVIKNMFLSKQKL